MENVEFLNKFKVGDFYVVETYADLTEREADEHRYDDETPTAYVVISPDIMDAIVQGTEYKDLSEFFSEYTYDTIEGIAYTAEKMGGLAFVYRPTLEKRFYFPKTMPTGAGEALVAFMSTRIQVREQIAKKLHVGFSPQNRGRFFICGNSIIVGTQEEVNALETLFRSIGEEPGPIESMFD